MISISEAAKQLNVTTKTLRAWDKSGKLKSTRLPNGHRRYSEKDVNSFTLKAESGAISQIINDVTAGDGYAVPPIQQYVGIINAVNKFYRNPDEAVRANRENARNLLRNLTIREPLQARMLAVAELPWSIEPEDKKDDEQVWVAGELTKIFEDIPDFLKYRMALLWAIWFGRSAVQNVFQWNFDKDYRRLMVNKWSPVHGDSLEFKWDSEKVGILVGLWGAGGYGLKGITSEATDVSRAHVLDDQDTATRYLTYTEREAFVIHSHDLVAGDFFEPEMQGGVKGVGLRSVVYWSSYIQSELFGWLIDFTERVGTGITLYKFLRGNEASYNATRALAESQDNSAFLLVPVDPAMNGGQPIEGVERIEPSSVAVENLLKIIDGYLGSQIHRYIVGQDATSKPVPSGMNSGVAEAHESTFARIVKFDATNLQETLTRELLWVVQKWTFPEVKAKCKFVLAADKPDVKEVMEAAKLLYDMGAEIDEDELRAIVGLTRPDPDAAVLSLKKQQEEMQPQMPGMPGGDIIDMPGKTMKDLPNMMPPEAQGKGLPAMMAWEESKHPRADDGKFGSGGGGSKPESARSRIGKLADGIKAAGHAAYNPGETAKRAGAFLKTKLKEMHAKYGTSGTIAILTAAAIATPIPVPGATAIAVYATTMLLKLFQKEIT